MLFIVKSYAFYRKELCSLQHEAMPLFLLPIIALPIKLAQGIQQAFNIRCNCRIRLGA